MISVNQRILNDNVTEAEKYNNELKIKIKPLPRRCAHSAGYRIGYRQANISVFAPLEN